MFFIMMATVYLFESHSFFVLEESFTIPCFEATDYVPEEISPHHFLVSRYDGQDVAAVSCGIIPSLDLDALELVLHDESDPWSDFLCEDTASYIPILPVREDSGMFGIKTSSGRIIHPAQYEKIISCTFQSFFGKKHGKWYYLDNNGNVSTTSFEEVNSFSEGLCVVKSGGKWGVIDSDGQWVAQPQFDDADNKVREGRLSVSKNGMWIFVRYDGAVLSSDVFDGASGFTDGVAIVQLNHKCAIIRQDFSFVTEPIYDYAFRPSDGMIATCYKGKWGYVDTLGRVKVAHNYDFAFRFRRGLGYVLKNNQIFSVSLNGTVDEKPIRTITQ